MNSIVTQKKTENWSLNQVDPALLARLQTIIAAAFFTILLVSFRPFNVGQSGSAQLATGDVVNQIGFGSIGILSLFAILALVDRRVVGALLSPWWIMLFLCAFFSASHALDTASSYKALAFTLVCIMAMLAVLVLPSGAEGYQQVLMTASVCVLGMSYIGLIVAPNIAMHNGFSSEPEHAGLWRGIYSHKNIAGPVMAGISFMGIYAFRRGARVLGGIVAVAGLIFVANTGSKTSAGLVPLVIFLIMVPGFFGLRKFASFTVFITILTTILGTVGTVVFSSLGSLREMISPGATFTGRVEIWKFALKNIYDHPWIGFGFDSFWYSPFVYYGEKDFEATWDVHGVIHGHNGYVDIALTMGIPALFLALTTMILIPVIDYAKCIKAPENIRLADMFMMIFAFSALNACLESFFFRRADPVWLLFVMAAFGLRLTARFVVPSKT